MSDNISDEYLKGKGILLCKTRLNLQGAEEERLGEYYIPYCKQLLFCYNVHVILALIIAIFVLFSTPFCTIKSILLCLY